MRLLLALLVGMLASVPAYAHSWYELGCCGDGDCKPVADGVVEETVKGVEVKGFGVLKYDDERLRWSKDDKDHVCANPNGPRLICVYRKPKGM